MTRRDALAGLIVAGALGVGGCNPFPATCRMRLTLVLDTPLGRRTGSSVIQVKAWEILHYPGTNRFDRKNSGEAVVIPVGDDVVFAVLDQGIAKRMLYATLQGRPWSSELLSEIRRVSAEATAEPTYELPEEDWPSLVRFADRNVPESIQAVCLNVSEPEERGPCAIRIVRATVTPTRDRITRRVLDYLPWLTTRHGSMLPMRELPLPRPEQQYTNSDFLRDLD